MKDFDFERARVLMDSAKRIALVIHARPDGDCVGSALALKRVLSKKGKDVKVISPDPVPSFLQWLPGAGEIVIFRDNPKEAEGFLRAADLIILLDFNAFHRTGADLEKVLENLLPEKTMLMIDHHLQPDERIPYRFSDPRRASTAELVFDFLKETGLISLLDKEAAECLYTGIMTDTGSFKFGQTTGDTHRISAELMDMGIDTAAIHSSVYDAYTPEKLQLLAEALKKMKFLEECKTSYIALDQETLERYGYRPGDTEGVVNYGLALKDAKFTALISQKPGEDIIRFSFRSKGNFDVNAFARKYFNGGGHKNAAGGSFEGSFREAVEAFEKAVKENCDQIAKS